MHLFLLRTCRHKCPMCCNNLYDIDEIPVATVEELKTVDTICFTGGEPFLVEDLSKIAVKLKKQFPNITTIYSYTSGFSLLMYMKKFADKGKCGLEGLDGITISPKDGKDWSAAKTLMANDIYRKSLKKLSSNRIYVFLEDEKTDENGETVSSPADDIQEYLTDSNFELIKRYWDPEFKTPDNEIFRRLPILLDK